MAERGGIGPLEVELGVELATGIEQAVMVCPFVSGGGGVSVGVGASGLRSGIVSTRATDTYLPRATL